MNRQLRNKDKDHPKLMMIRENSQCLSDRAKSYLDLIFEEIPWIDDETIRTATELYKDFRVDGSFGNGDPKPLVAGIVYYSCVMDGSNVNQEEIANVLNIAKQTVVYGYKKVKVLVQNKNGQ